MAGWSSMGRFIQGINPLKHIKPHQTGLQRCMSGGHGPRFMPLTPSRWQWHKFKDLAHFYIMVGLIPVGLVVTYANIFIGPATLVETPEDYVPKHWEYYRHPIQRFFARYVYASPQQEYEKFMHNTFEEDEKAKIRALEHKIKLLMNQRGDYQSYYYRPIISIAKYRRAYQENEQKLLELRGD